MRTSTRRAGALLAVLAQVLGGPAAGQNGGRGTTGLEFLTGTWITSDTMIAREGGTRVATGQATYAWGVGEQWLLWDFSTLLERGIRYVVHGAAIWDSARVRYRAMVVNNVGQIIQYTGSWADDSTLTFDITSPSTPRGRVSFIKLQSGDVRLISERVDPSGHYRPWLVSRLRRERQSGPAHPDETGRDELVRLVQEVQDADYRGELGRLQSLAERIEPYTRNQRLARAAHHWRGFAFWRRALNAANEPDADFAEVERDFTRAAAEFLHGTGYRPRLRRGQDWRCFGLPEHRLVPSHGPAPVHPAHHSGPTHDGGGAAAGS